MPASRLYLEITASALVADTSALVPVLTALRQTGVRLAIDDFGAGHASLRFAEELEVLQHPPGP